MTPNLFLIQCLHAKVKSLLLKFQDGTADETVDVERVNVQTLEFSTVRELNFETLSAVALAKYYTSSKTSLFAGELCLTKGRKLAV